jgi:hypothetical protein
MLRCAVDAALKLPLVNRTCDASRIDAYFSVDVETDGPIPGRFSMLSLGVVYAGEYDGTHFRAPATLNSTFYAELRPISNEYEPAALAVNGLDRKWLLQAGGDPVEVMRAAAAFVNLVAGDRTPVLVAYPLCFDWSWIYWYFINFTGACPFAHSRAFDIKTAFAVKAEIPVNQAGHSQLAPELAPSHPLSHNALDDAIAQAEIFIKLFQWKLN